jgi:hypothetical protein
MEGSSLPFMLRRKEATLFSDKYGIPCCYYRKWLLKTKKTKTRRGTSHPLLTISNYEWHHPLLTKMTIKGVSLMDVIDR